MKTAAKAESLLTVTANQSTNETLYLPLLQITATFVVLPLCVTLYTDVNAEVRLGH